MPSQFVYFFLVFNIPIENIALVVAGNDMRLGWGVISSEMFSRIEELFVFKGFEAFVDSNIEDVQRRTFFTAD